MKKNCLLLYHQISEVSQGIIQTLTLVAVASFGESLRWVPHHPSGGSHLTTNIPIIVLLKDNCRRNLFNWQNYRKSCTRGR